MDSKSDKVVDAIGDSLEKTLLKEEKEEEVEDAKVLQLQTSEQEADQGGDKKESLLVTAEKDADKGEEEKKKKKQGPNVDQSAEKDESTDDDEEDEEIDIPSVDDLFAHDGYRRAARSQQLWSNVKRARQTGVYTPGTVDNMMEIMATGKVWGNMTMAELMQKRNENKSKQSAVAGKGEKSTEEKKKAEESSSSGASNLNKPSKISGDEEFKKMMKSQRKEFNDFAKFMNSINGGDYDYGSDSDSD